jgi:hypothetical protein
MEQSGISAAVSSAFCIVDIRVDGQESAAALCSANLPSIQATLPDPLPSWGLSNCWYPVYQVSKRPSFRFLGLPFLFGAFCLQKTPKKVGFYHNTLNFAGQQQKKRA